MIIFFSRRIFIFSGQNLCTDAITVVVELIHYIASELDLNLLGKTIKRIILFLFNSFFNRQISTWKTIELFNDAIPSLLPPHTVCVLTIWRLDQKTQAGAAGKSQGHVFHVPCCVIMVAFGIDRGEKKKATPLLIVRL